MTITCPKCSETFPVVVQALITKSQVLYMKLTCEHELFGSELIGIAIQDMTKVQMQLAAGMGVKVCVFLKSVLIEPYQVTIGFQIVQVKV